MVHGQPRVGPGNSTPSSLSGLQASGPPRLEGGASLGTHPLPPRNLPPAPRLFMPRGACKPVPSYLQPPLGLPPMPVVAQVPEGAETAGGWRVSAVLSVCTPSEAVTVRRLGRILPEVRAGANSGEKPGSGSRHPRARSGQGLCWASESTEMSTAAAGCLQLHPGSSCSTSWEGAGLLLVPGSPASERAAPVAPPCSLG